MPVTWNEIRTALMELATSERIDNFHVAIVKQGHKWQGQEPSRQEVADMVFSVISNATRGDKPNPCGQASCGGICAAYYLWQSGIVQVELYYTPEMASATLEQSYTTPISQLEAGDVVRPFRQTAEPFTDAIVLAVDHQKREVKFSRPHAISPMYDIFGFGATAYSRCEEWVVTYSEHQGSQEQFIVIGAI